MTTFAQFYTVGSQYFATLEAAKAALDKYEPIVWIEDSNGNGGYDIIPSCAVIEHTVTDQFGDQQHDVIVSHYDLYDPVLLQKKAELQYEHNVMMQEGY
jgi:hypothetical protein